MIGDERRAHEVLVGLGWTRGKHAVASWYDEPRRTCMTYLSDGDPQFGVYVLVSAPKYVERQWERVMRGGLEEVLTEAIRLSVRGDG